VNRDTDDSLSTVWNQLSVEELAIVIGRWGESAIPSIRNRWQRMAEARAAVRAQVKAERASRFSRLPPSVRREVKEYQRCQAINQTLLDGSIP
jgi:hypothetical protein